MFIKSVEIQRNKKLKDLKWFLKREKLKILTWGFSYTIF